MRIELIEFFLILAPKMHVVIKGIVLCNFKIYTNFNYELDTKEHMHLTTTFVISINVTTTMHITHATLFYDKKFKLFKYDA